MNFGEKMSYRVNPLSWARFFEQVIDEHPFRLPGLYNIVYPIGCGGFGHVIAATDNRTNESVCIKRMRVQENSFHIKCIVREISLMRQFNNHANLLGIRSAFSCPYTPGIGYIYVVTERMDTDLDKLIRLSATNPSQIEISSASCNRRAFGITHGAYEDCDEPPQCCSY